MKKNVWIINHYATGMLFKKGGRHYWFAKYLKREGFEPVIFSCNVRHGSQDYYFDTDKLWFEKRADEIDVPFVIVKSSLYKGNGKDRVLNMVNFYHNVQKAVKEYAKLYEKPDVIYASSVHPLALVAGIKLARYFGIKCICEVRDLWPETLVAYEIANNFNPIIIFLRYLEKWIYKNADSIIFTMAGGYDYIEEQGWGNDIPKAKVHYINNGIDLAQFDYNKTHFTIQDEDLENENIFKVVYTGSIRRVNNLGKLIDIARHVRNPNIKFLIWGDGNELSMLKNRIKNEHVNNIIFKGWVEKKNIPYITSQADLNLAHSNGSPILRFGTSANKLFDYMAAGKPIMRDSFAKYSPVETYHAGVSVDTGDVKDIALAIEMMANLDKNTLKEYGLNARRGAYEFDFGNLSKKLIAIIDGINNC